MLNFNFRLNKYSKTGLYWLWVAVIILALDRLTKFLAQTYLTAYVPLPVVKFFNLTLAYNTGAAFSFLNQAGGWQGKLFGGIAFFVSIGILFWLYRLTHRQRWLCIALSMIVGGALGNLGDRILYGHVIDFIQLYVSHWYWPVFNIADSAICIGVGMLFLDALRKK